MPHVTLTINFKKDGLQNWDIQGPDGMVLYERVAKKNRQLGDFSEIANALRNITLVQLAPRGIYLPDGSTFDYDKYFFRKGLMGPKDRFNAVDGSTIRLMKASRRIEVHRIDDQHGDRIIATISGNELELLKSEDFLMAPKNAPTALLDDLIVHWAAKEAMAPSMAQVSQSSIAWAAGGGVGMGMARDM